LQRFYGVCLPREISKVGLDVKREVNIPIVYDSTESSKELRLDLLVENCIIIEVKAVEPLNPVWDAQIISHLNLLNKDLEFSINFNVPLIKSGIRRFTNTKRIIKKN
jgi:GxxExxY protein